MTRSREKLTRLIYSGEEKEANYNNQAEQLSTLCSHIKAFCKKWLCTLKLSVISQEQEVIF
jgi:hypothetical protein